MIRDSEKRKLELKGHDDSQFYLFNVRKRKLREAAERWKSRAQIKKHDLLMKEHDEMIYQFDSSAAALHFGDCEKFNKPVVFIPSVCQLETQECFEHRKDTLSVNSQILKA